MELMLALRYEAALGAAARVRPGHVVPALRAAATTAPVPSRQQDEQRQRREHDHRAEDTEHLES
jgi:hypothetical protein